jgi:hypothetical protein
MYSGIISLYSIASSIALPSLAEAICDEIRLDYISFGTKRKIAVTLGRLFPVFLRITERQAGSFAAFVLNTDDKLHDLFLVAEVLGFVVRGAQIALLRDKIANVFPEQGRHRLALPVRFTPEPLVFVFGETNRDGMCARQG